MKYIIVSQATWKGNDFVHSLPLEPSQLEDALRVRQRGLYFVISVSYN